MVLGASSLIGAARAGMVELPTRLVRASVVDVRCAIRGADIYRMLVDCVGVTTREPIHGAVILGWSGMQWQTTRPQLKPTTRNVKTGVEFSDNAVDRMAEMTYDLDSVGWDGDEVCIGFYGRDAVVLGTFQHRWGGIDLEPNVISETLEAGRRLQDDPDWDVSNISEGRDILAVARDNSHPDALNFRWGQMLATFWETRGLVMEFAVPNPQQGKLYNTRIAGLELSPEWFWAESRRIRLTCFDEDVNPETDLAPTDRHVFLISDGVATGNPFPPAELLVDGMMITVTGENPDGSEGSFLGCAATKDSGGDSSDDELASATRYPEIRKVIDRMQAQIDELRSQVEATRDYLFGVVTAIAEIIVPNGVGGIVALTTAEMENALATIPEDLTPIEEGPSAQNLSNARSEVFRVGR